MEGLTMLASIESLLGSIWFALLLGVVGYIAGSVYPLRKLFK
jgi:hypothetical protein